MQVVLEFPYITIDGAPGVLHMASALTISYSVYRKKAPVYNLGQPILSGFSVGHKYVAGSLVTVAFDIDEISDFINRMVRYRQSKFNTYVDDPDTTNNKIDRNKPVGSSFEVNLEGRTRGTYKNVHTIMRDDLTEFNMHVIMEDEIYGPDRARKLIVYGCQFINNGQVMSIDDIVTENTLSFIARDVREQFDARDKLESIASGVGNITTASDVLTWRRG